MAHVYGDSTPFPYDVNYIELCSRTIDCSVQLLSAQHAIATALERSKLGTQLRSTESARILAMSEVASSAFEAFVNSDADRIARRILDSVSRVCNEEIAEIDKQSQEDEARTQNVVARSIEAAHRSLETFVASRDLPGTDVALSWAAAGEQGYTGQVAVRTPFGVSAAFSLAVPAEHVWARPRRVGDITPGLEVHCPQQSGWLARRVEMASIKLDKLCLLTVQLDGVRAEFRLGKSPSTGASFRVVVELLGTQQVWFEQLGEDGAQSAEGPLQLDGEDSAQMLRFCNDVVESMSGLAQLRGNASALETEGLAMTDLEWPQLMAERLLSHISPLANEIALRSGAPGEWVLRRDVGGGRREEIYITKAELFEKVSILPPERRAIFRALGLVDSAPAPSEPASGSRPVAEPSVIVEGNARAPAA